jgi:hypothetical protein
LELAIVAMLASNAASALLTCPYHDWKLQGYKCVMGKYIPKHEA